MNDLVEGAVWYAAFLFSVTLHEASHAWAAKRGGDLTAYRGGQVSIDPAPHIRREPVGMVVLPVVSLALVGWPFGFASTPYDPRWARRYPRRAAWMSLAGPTANLALVILAAIGIRLGIGLGWLQAPESVWLTEVTAAVEPGAGSIGALGLSVFFSLNLILFLLNLIPLPPLDGSGALPLLLGEKSAVRLGELLRRPWVAWTGLILAWNLFEHLFGPVFGFAVNLLYPGSHYG